MESLKIRDYSRDNAPFFLSFFFSKIRSLPFFDRSSLFFFFSIFPSFKREERWKIRYNLLLLSVFQLYLF